MRNCFYISFKCARVKSLQHKPKRRNEMIGYNLYQVTTVTRSGTLSGFPVEAPNESEARGRADEDLLPGEQIVKIECVAVLAN